MVSYSCPTCAAKLTAEAASAGDKHFCPNCGQRLQVPAAPDRDKTILGKVATASLIGAVPEVLAAEPVLASNRLAVGVCAILFGWLGWHYFLLGRISLGIASLILGLAGIPLTLHCLPLIIVPWGFAIYDGVRYLSMTDQQFMASVVHLSDEEKRRTRFLWIMIWSIAAIYALVILFYVLLIIGYVLSIINSVTR